jgi:hypothetical protein
VNPNLFLKVAMGKERNLPGASSSLFRQAQYDKGKEQLYFVRVLFLIPGFQSLQIVAADLSDFPVGVNRYP